MLRVLITQSLPNVTRIVVRRFSINNRFERHIGVFREHFAEHITAPVDYNYCFHFISETNGTKRIRGNKVEILEGFDLRAIEIKCVFRNFQRRIELWIILRKFLVDMDSLLLLIYS